LGAIPRESHRSQLEWHRRVLDVRHKEIVPRLPTIRAGGTYRILDDGCVVVCWWLGASGELSLAANLSAKRLDGVPTPSGRVIWGEGEAGDDGVLGPFAVRGQ
jgi:hypothetical protein